jgi:hypothetical protein
MASLIRLKQIESGSLLQTSANLGNNFSQSVINLVSQSVKSALPAGVVSGSSQLDGTIIKNLTLGTDTDAYSLIVSGALAVVDTEITIDTNVYNVPGEIWINGETGSAGNAPVKPYTPTGQPDANILDNGEW